MVKLIATLLLPALASAWTSSTTASSHKPTALSRADFFKATTSAGLASLLIPIQSAQAASETTLPNGVSYEVIKSGKGAKPDTGELVAVRFSAFCGDIKIDDIFDTPEPYYTRVGSGGLIKGVEETLPLMQLGDRWKLTIPGKMAFGSKGRPASPGKPRIPGDATIVFEIEMVGLPGKEPELIELIGDV